MQYTSGQFAGMFRVSKKLLRHYNEIGLLTPSEVNPENGYYLYGEQEREKMKLLMYLRALKIPLPDIKKLIGLPKEQWSEDIRRHLAAVRRQQRQLTQVETELLLLERQILKREELNKVDRKTEYSVRVFTLQEPIYVIGRGVRVKHGSPEHMPSIEKLIEDFFGDDVPALIPNHSEPVMRFGICAEFTPKTSEFSYIFGDQAKEPSSGMLPDTLRGYTILAGDYACVTFSAPDLTTITTEALMPGYDELFGWLDASDEWKSADLGVAYEVYDDKRFEVPSWPEMDIWTPVKRKSKKDGKAGSAQGNIEIITLDEDIKVVGLNLQKSGLPITFNSLGELWGAYGEKCRGKVKNPVVPVTEYGIRLNRTPDYITGCAVAGTGELPEGWTHYVIPKGRYVKDTFTADSFEQLASGVIGKRNVKAWAKKNNVAIGGDYCVEVYPNDAIRGGGAEMYVLTPVK